MRSLVFLLSAIVLTGCGARSGLGDLAAEDLRDGDVDALFDDGASPSDGAPLDDASFDDGSVGYDGTPIDDAGLDDAPFLDATVPAACPGAVPLNGAPCAFSGACTYAGCDPKRPDVATCSGGKWSVVATACAPPTKGVCPITMPAEASACTLVAGEECHFDDCRPSSARGACLGGKWQIKRGNCVPGAAICPLTMPAEGASCPDLGSGVEADCSVRNECGLPSLTVCRGGAWHNDDVPPCATLPGCPAAPPAPLSPVATGSPTYCVYRQPCGAFVVAHALGGEWFIERFPCPDGSCPTTDHLADACSSAGKSCTYPSGSGCELDCVCTSGAWTCKQTCAPATGGGK